ncbi:MAG: type IV pilus assembly protein FimV [Gammaproteobacteria bacterium]
MKRIVIGNLLLVCLAGLLPGAATALGLGELKLNSVLNEPLDARIELLATTAEELDDLEIDLVDAEAFAERGIERIYMSNRLRFELVRERPNLAHIRVTTSDPVEQPFLRFLLKTSWTGKGLVREYSVYLKSPAGSATAASAAAKPAAKPAATTPAPTPAAEPAATPSAAADSTPRKKYGPTVAWDTLWSIASRVRPPSVSVQQMMLALLQANPHAFDNNNINGLKAKQILLIPTADEIGSGSVAAAISEVKAQSSNWQQGQAAAPVPAPAPAQQAEANPLPVDDAAEATAAADSVEPDDGLVIANERIASLLAENDELKEQLAEIQIAVETLRRSIQLKENELAALEAQMRESDQGFGDTISEWWATLVTGAEKGLASTVEMIEQTPIPDLEMIKDNPVWSVAAGGILLLLVFVWWLAKALRVEGPDDAGSVADSLRDSEATDQAATDRAATERPATEMPGTISTSGLTTAARQEPAIGVPAVETPAVGTPAAGKEVPAGRVTSPAIFGSDDSDEVPDIAAELDLGADDSDATPAIAPTDDNSTKLDLAKAYVELGDKAGAKSLLYDILAVGDVDQRQQARELLDQI